MQRVEDHLMSVHITREKMEAFCALELPGQETFTVARHFGKCTKCRQLFDLINKSRRDDHQPLVFRFTPDITEDEHVEYDDLVAYAEGNTVEAQTYLLEQHIRRCVRCEGDLKSFQSFLIEFDQYRNVWLGPQPFSERFKSAWGWIMGSLQMPSYPKPALTSLIVTATLIAAALIGMFINNSQNDNSTANLSANSPSYTTEAPNQDSDSANDDKPELGDREFLSGGESSEGGLNKQTKNLLVALNDGGSRFGIDKRGYFVGVANYPPELRQEIRRALRNELPQSVLSNDVMTAPVKTRGASNNDQVRLVGPSNSYVTSAHPTLTWQPLRMGASYVVVIFDNDFNEVERSVEITGTNYKISRDLQRGSVYMWQVLAYKDGTEITPAQREVGKFKVVSDAIYKKMQDARKKYKSHLALGLTYKRENLLYEAEHEFKQLLAANPKSKVARSLLNSVRTK